MWRPERLDLLIDKIDFLADVKDSLITKLTVSLPLSALDETTAEEFITCLDRHKGNAELCLKIYD